MSRQKRSTVAFALAMVIGVVADTSSPMGALATRDAGEPLAGRIAYSTYEIDLSKNPSSTQNVYTSTPSGTDTRLVARDATSPVWSRDGRWLAYVRGYRELWRVRADGTGNRRVSRAATGTPAWSPNGKRLAYTRPWEVMVDGYPEERAAIYIVGRNGTAARRLHEGTGFGPAWSADGQLIAFTRRGSLSVIEPDGEHLRTVRADMWPHEPRFSPSGRRLVFTDFAQEPSALRILDVRTGVVNTIAEAAFGGRPESVTWTPNGRRLAFFLSHWVTEDTITHVDAVELYTIRPNGTGRRQLATLPPEVMSWGGLSWVR